MQSIRYTFLSNRNIHKSSYGLCFGAPDPLIDRFLVKYTIKGPEVQKKSTGTYMNIVI